MFLLISSVLIGGWLVFMGWKFYRSIDWAEPPDPSPDLHGMRKQHAQLIHVQEILEEACQKGKISQAAVDEFNRYCQSEMDAARAVETEWRNRNKSKIPGKLT